MAEDIPFWDMQPEIYHLYLLFSLLRFGVCGEQTGVGYIPFCKLIKSACSSAVMAIVRGRGGLVPGLTIGPVPGTLL